MSAQPSSGEFNIGFSHACWCLGGFWSPSLCAQEVIDRIVARVENDVILLSDVRFCRYQLAGEGKSEKATPTFWTA